MLPHSPARLHPSPGLQYVSAQPTQRRPSLAPCRHRRFSIPTSNTLVFTDLMKKKARICHLLKILHRKMSKRLTWPLPTSSSFIPSSLPTYFMPSYTSFTLPECAMNSDLLYLGLLASLVNLSPFSLKPGKATYLWAFPNSSWRVSSLFCMLYIL